VSKPPPRKQDFPRYIVKTAAWELFSSTFLGEVGGILRDSINSTAEGISRALKLYKKRGGGHLVVPSTANAAPEPCSRRQGLRMLKRPKYNRLLNELLKEIRSHNLVA